MTNTACAMPRQPHGKGAKPRTMIAQPSRRHAPPGPATPAQAEGLALRAAARLCADNATADTGTRYRTYMDGYIAAMQAIGLLPDQRAIVLRQACHQMLNGTITLQDYAAMTAERAPIDPVYVRAVQHARRQRTTTAAELASALCISTGTARQLIDRMVQHHVLNPADMFGVYTLDSAEVLHG